MQEHLEAGGEFILLGIIIIVMYQVTVCLYRKWRRSRMKYSPVSNEEIDKMMRDLRDDLRSPARYVQCSYELFSGREIKVFISRPQPWETEENDVTCLKLILDNKLCLFFFENRGRENSWVYDGFEAGDYSHQSGETID